MSNKTAPKPRNLLKFHRPRTSAPSSASIPSRRMPSRRRFPIDPETTTQIPQPSPESRQCLSRLAAYRPPKILLDVPRSRCAAVLVALFVGRMGDLYVLLSRRSATLRTYAGDTSLPGGKMDKTDKNVEVTARREAFEEIGLPMDRRKVPLLCILEPFLAAELVVTPVVVLILDNTLRPILNAAEVASLFSHPLASFLSSTPPFQASEPESVEVEYHTSFLFQNSAPHGKRYSSRVHQFLTGREAGGIKPIFGLTAAMMIRVAMIGYGWSPDFEVQTLETPGLEERIAWALLNRPVFRTASEREGVDLRKAMKICGVTKEEFEEIKEEQDGNQESKSQGTGEIGKARRRWMKVWRSKL